MQNYLVNMFNSQLIVDLIISSLASTLIGSIICITYAYSHSRAIYSKSFNMSLIVFTILSSMSIFILSENMTLAIGALGALSIVRYRNVVKDHRDIVFLFWAISAGVCSGLSEYILAGTGSFVIFTIMIILGGMSNYEKVLIVIRGKNGLENNVLETLNKNLSGKVKLKVDNSTSKKTELIFQLPNIDLKKRKSIYRRISENLYEIEGIEAVNFVRQVEEMAV